MKLTELEPTLDPRHPLHFGTAATADARSQRFAAGRRAAVAPGDLRSVDAVIARLAAHPPLTDRDAAPAPVPPSAPTPAAAPAALAARAAQAARLFTGAATGVVVAVWRARSDELEARLRSRLADAWTDLVAQRSAAEATAPTDLTPLQHATSAAQDAWDELAGFDALHRAFTAGDVRALSSTVAASFALKTATAGRTAAALDRRTGWGDGVVWTSGRLVAWSSAADGIQLFTASGSDLAGWLTGRAPDLTWTAHFVGHVTRFADVPGDWQPVLATLGRLAALGTVAVGTPAAAAVPVTRFLMTAAEARTGIDPVDLTTGAAPTDADWDPAHYRETYSAAQNRRIRTFVDAGRRGSHPPVGHILVTVLPR